MIVVERQSEIAQPIQRVWQVYTDFPNWASWFEERGMFTTVRYAFAWSEQDAPATQGSRLLVLAQGQPFVWTAERWEPPFGFTFSSETEGGPAPHSFTLDLRLQTVGKLTTGATPSDP